MTERSILFLTEKDVRSLLSMKELVPLMEQALGKFSGGANGGIVQPVRSVVPVQEHEGCALHCCSLYSGVRSSQSTNSAL